MANSNLSVALRCAVLLVVSAEMVGGAAVARGPPPVRDYPSADGSQDPSTQDAPQPPWGGKTLVMNLKLELNHATDERITQRFLDTLAGIGTWLKGSDTNECSPNPYQHGGACINGNSNYQCTCAPGYTGDHCKIKPRDCSDFKRAEPGSVSGLYTIYPNDTWPARVYCDMDTGRGGWTVFQRRQNGRVNFYRNWEDYAAGFGDVDDEVWLGNRLLHTLTERRNYRLRVDLGDWENNTRVAEYDLFVVSSEQDKFRLTVGNYTGTADDSLAYHNGGNFSTKDVDNDSSSRSCAQTYKGAWWYKDCHYSNLNGLYLQGIHTSNYVGVNWYHWKVYYTLKTTSMSIRPVDF